MWDLRPHTKSEHGHYAQHRRHLFNVAQCDMCCGVTYGETEMLGERLLIFLENWCQQVYGSLILRIFVITILNFEL